MWVFTNKGFFSIVEDRNDSTKLLVRSRIKGDLERVFDDVHCEADWKTDKKEHNKTKLTMMDEYDVTAVMSRGEPSPDADATVRKRMEMRAQFNKYLGKQALQKEGWS